MDLNCTAIGCLDTEDSMCPSFRGASWTLQHSGTQDPWPLLSGFQWPESCYDNQNCLQTMPQLPMVELFQLRITVLLSWLSFLLKEKHKTKLIDM